MTGGLDSWEEFGQVTARVMVSTTRLSRFPCCFCILIWCHQCKDYLLAISTRTPVALCSEMASKCPGRH